MKTCFVFFFVHFEKQKPQSPGNCMGTLKVIIGKSALIYYVYDFLSRKLFSLKYFMQ